MLNDFFKKFVFAGRRNSSDSDTDALSNYEFQNNSEMEENELFSIDNQTDDVQSPMAKRAKIDIASNYDQYHELATISKADVIDKPSTVCEFEIFGNYVAAVMKNMRKNDARQLQMKIVQLINSFDRDELV